MKDQQSRLDTRDLEKNPKTIYNFAFLEERKKGHFLFASKLRPTLVV